jgi:hypothetical protein
MAACLMISVQGMHDLFWAYQCSKAEALVIRVDAARLDPSSDPQSELTLAHPRGGFFSSTPTRRTLSSCTTASIAFSLQPPQLLCLEL